MTTSHSTYRTTELALSTQYEQVNSYSYTVSRSETIAPYAALGITSSQFDLMIVVEFVVLIGAVLLILRPVRPRLPTITEPKLVEEKISPARIEKWTCKCGREISAYLSPGERVECKACGSPHYGGSGVLSDTTKRALKISSPKLVPIVTITLIVINVLFFFLEESRGGSDNLSVLVQMGAIYRSGVAAGQYYRLVSAMFLHIGIQHLLFNMYALLFIGMALERVYGYFRFLTVYVLCGIIGNALSALTLPEGFVGAGASGAILGCLAALIVLQSRYSHVSFGISTGSAVVSLFYNLVSGFTPGSGIDIAAHIGGAVGGILLAFLVSPPSSFSAYVRAQGSPIDQKPAGPDSIQQTTAQQQRQTEYVSSRQVREGTSVKKIAVAAIVAVVLVGLFSGAFLIGGYPALHVESSADAISLHSDPYETAGTIKVHVDGSGILTIWSIGVSADHPSLAFSHEFWINTSSGKRPGSLPLQAHLPSSLTLYVKGAPYSNLPIIVPFLPSTSTITVTLNGTWSYEFINMPIALTTSAQVKWTSQYNMGTPIPAGPRIVAIYQQESLHRWNPKRCRVS